MLTKTSILLFMVFLICCRQQDKGFAAIHTEPAVILKPAVPANINEIPVPDGFLRPYSESHSFATWLRQVRLKKDKTVYLYNGKTKHNQSAQFAVLDITTGNKDLQQCADAVMRLRAEYLFAKKQYHDILFIDNKKKEYRFTSPFSREHLNEYLERVFGMCGSASLAKQLHYVNEFSRVKPGDVIIRGGFPGHAVIVMDMAINNEGKKIFLLAQSYMPAQDIHILKNPVDDNLSPWYSADVADKIITPEYIFDKRELMRW